jgi:hypothetical protein
VAERVKTNPKFIAKIQTKSLRPGEIFEYDSTANWIEKEKNHQYTNPSSSSLTQHPSSSSFYLMKLT